MGNVTIGPYSTNLTYSLSGNTHGSYTMASFSNRSTIPNPDLVPLTSTELEFGIDARFFNNRLGIDYTYYDQETTDDILRATISNSSGFNSTTVNIGKITNKGHEVLLYGTPVQGALTWDVSLNFARNTNEVVSLMRYCQIPNS